MQDFVPYSWYIGQSEPLYYPDHIPSQSLSSWRLYSGIAGQSRFYVKFQSACSNLPAKSTRESLSDWAERLDRSPSRSSPCGRVPDLCICRCQVLQSRFSSNPAGNPSFFRRLQLPSILVPPSLQTCSREGRRAGLWNISGFRLLSHGSAPRTYDFLFWGPSRALGLIFR